MITTQTNIKTFSDDTFEAAVLQNTKPVLVDLWADWCGPCRALAPTIESIAADYEGRLVVGKLDVDANPATAAKYGIRSIPTVLIFQEGEVVERISGLNARENYDQALGNLIEPGDG